MQQVVHIRICFLGAIKNIQFWEGFHKRAEGRVHQKRVRAAALRAEPAVEGEGEKDNKHFEWREGQGSREVQAERG